MKFAEKIPLSIYFNFSRGKKFKLGVHCTASHHLSLKTTTKPFQPFLFYDKLEPMAKLLPRIKHLTHSEIKIIQKRTQ